MAPTAVVVLSQRRQAMATASNASFNDDNQLHLRRPTPPSEQRIVSSPYYQLLSLPSTNEEASFSGWFLITIWLLVGYVIYSIELLNSSNNLGYQ